METLARFNHKNACSIRLCYETFITATLRTVSVYTIQIQLSNIYSLKSTKAAVPILHLCIVCGHRFSASDPHIFSFKKYDRHQIVPIPFSASAAKKVNIYEKQIPPSVRLLIMPHCLAIKKRAVPAPTPET